MSDGEKMAFIGLPMRNVTDPPSRARQRLRIGQLLLAADLAALTGFSLINARLGVSLTFTAVVLTVIGSQGGYQRRFSVRVDQAIPRLLTAVAVAALTVGIFFDDHATVDVIHVAPMVLGAMVLVRAVISFILHRINRRKAPAELALVLGAGTTGVLLVEHLQGHREYGLEPVGFVDRVKDDNLPLPVLGDVQDLELLVETTGARQIIIAFGLVPEVELVSVIRRCQSLDVDVWVVPRFFELGLGRQRVDGDEVWGIPLSRLPRLALRSAEWQIKRVFDLVASSLALAVFSPVFVAVAAAVRFSSAGPIFFSQVRVGQRGRDFELLKFRTMRVNDDSTTTWSVARDSRVTAVGRVLRRTCLDELPQFLNVIRGDMSLVGPRPERPHFVDIFRDSVRCYDDRHRVPVGLTGLAQIHGLRGDTSIEERAVFDNNYIENWSLWSDIAILIRTFAAIVQSPEKIRTPLGPEEPAASERAATHRPPNPHPRAKPSRRGYRLRDRGLAAEVVRSADGVPTESVDSSTAL